MQVVDREVKGVVNWQIFPLFQTWIARPPHTGKIKTRRIWNGRLPPDLHDFSGEEIPPKKKIVSPRPISMQEIFAIQIETFCNDVQSTSFSIGFTSAGLINDKLLL